MCFLGKTLFGGIRYNDYCLRFEIMFALQQNGDWCGFQYLMNCTYRVVKDSSKLIILKCSQHHPNALKFHTVMILKLGRKIISLCHFTKTKDKNASFMLLASIRAERFVMFLWPLILIMPMIISVFVWVLPHFPVLWPAIIWCVWSILLSLRTM